MIRQHRSYQSTWMMIIVKFKSVSIHHPCYNYYFMSDSMVMLFHFSVNFLLYRLNDYSTESLIHQVSFTVRAHPIIMDHFKSLIHFY